MSLSTLEAFLAEHRALALVTVAEARGSTPREEGAWMLVSPVSIFGTIGGGQLEFMAIERARVLLSGEVAEAHLDIALGPEIGQCCGGRVGLEIVQLGDTARTELLVRVGAEEAALPHVLLFGGGHVGHALAATFKLLPVRASVIETRAEALEGLPEGTTSLLTPVPEEAVRQAPPGSAFIVLTHDHALDFLIVAEALRRPDAAYVGMIGSKTKRATFRNWWLREAGGAPEALDRLVCPIGGEGINDKRPAVIAALTAAEVMRSLTDLY